MRNYSKTGGKIGKPGYRTPSSAKQRKIKRLWGIDRRFKNKLVKIAKTTSSYQG